MKRIALFIAAWLAVLPAGAAEPLSDAQIVQAVIRQSIASFPAPCACPYSRGPDGHVCGEHSGYNHIGGATPPLCYAAQVTPAMITRYRLGRH